VVVVELLSVVTATVLSLLALIWGIFPIQVREFGGLGPVILFCSLLPFWFDRCFVSF
jgi:hypothetical protein